MIILYILLLIFKSSANEYPSFVYGIMPYGYNTFQQTTITPDSDELEGSDSDEYVICTCKTCSDISCEEYCKTCPQNGPQKYKERKYILQYDRDALQNYRRLALRAVETTPTYRLRYSVPTVTKDKIDNENKVINKSNIGDIKIKKDNDVTTDLHNFIVRLTYNKDRNDIINVEFLLNDRNKVLQEETYVNTPIRRTKEDVKEDLANTHYRNMKMLQS